MPGGAAAVVPRMPLRAVGPVAAAVLRIPGKGTKIFFAGKIRSRFSVGAGTRTRPFPPGMPESCRLRGAPGRPIARRGSGSGPGHTPDARCPTPDARRSSDSGHSRPTCLSSAAPGSHPAVQSPDAAPARRGSGSDPGHTPDTVPCNAAPLCSAFPLCPAFPLCSAACSGAAAYARGRCGRMLFLRFAGENASFWESSEILLPLPRILNRNNNGISITQR